MIRISENMSSQNKLYELKMVTYDNPLLHKMMDQAKFPTLKRQLMEGEWGLEQMSD
jgi:hypothetical protein